MLSVWTKHLKTPKEKEGFEKYLLGSKAIFERLTEILKEEEANLNASELSSKAYDSPNWDYLQAHKNGYRQCLNVMQKIANLDRREK